jgi:hypothetical protein
VFLPLTKHYTYDEDFYAEEKYVPSIDWNGGFKVTALRINKCDRKVFNLVHGTSVGLFSYQGQWVVSGYCGNNVYSRQLCYRNNRDITGISEVISDLFWGLFKSRGWKLPQELNRCYMFVCHPEEDILQLVGARFSRSFISILLY